MSLQMVREWGWLQRSQWSGKKHLDEIQTEKLKWLVSHAYRKVHFCRKLCDGTTLDYGNVDLGSLSRLPIITKQRFRVALLPE
ncbi:MAG TPA: hypothetical protein VEG61_05025, partial [Candidatus Dormibacteraeota bacterium]|nr:hypothetical protein [Candidatus Dormibacteraeota bacterium]